MIDWYLTPTLAIFQPYRGILLYTNNNNNNNNNLFIQYIYNMKHIYLYMYIMIHTKESLNSDRQQFQQKEQPPLHQANEYKNTTT